jgi:ubiquinone/menaquinone biosynthesis C-methylase UbiE
MQHAFRGAEQWAKTFDDPERDAWQKPREVISELGLTPTMQVADLGAGTGYFSARLAEAVPEGRVWAIDTEPDMFVHLAMRARDAGLHHVVPVLASPADPRLPEAVDRVLIVNTYHHIEDRPAYFAQLRGSLRSGGEVAIVDFHERSPFGPPPEFRFTEAQIVREMGEAGYALKRSPTLLEHQHFLIFAPR